MAPITSPCSRSSEATRSAPTASSNWTEKVDGKPLLDRCAELDLAVAAGIWLQHERHGFDYTDEARVNAQRDMVRATVKQYRDHPALLVWVLGNEMEGDPTNPRASLIWKEINELAAIVKAEDPAHPVMTVIAGSDAAKVKAIIEHYPNLDILGVNAYAGAGGAGAAVKAAGWNKPFVLTEFGPTGHWEVPKSPWGASIEPTAREKAASYYATQRLAHGGSAGHHPRQLYVPVGTETGNHLHLVWHVPQDRRETAAGGRHVPRMDRPMAGEPLPAHRTLDSELRDATVPPGSLAVPHASPRPIRMATRSPTNGRSRRKAPTSAAAATRRRNHRRFRTS